MHSTMFAQHTVHGHGCYGPGSDLMSAGADFARQDMGCVDEVLLLCDWSSSRQENEKLLHVCSVTPLLHQGPAGY